MRTCAICGAELPANLRHGAMYCPHGRCKTKAYRGRQKVQAQKQEAKDAPRAPTLVPVHLPAETSASVPAASSTPLRFSHTVGCTCGQQLVIQILISHAQAAEPGPSEPPTVVEVKPVDQEMKDGPRAQVRSTTPALMAIDSARPREEIELETEYPLSGTSAAAEQTILDIEPSVVVPEKPDCQILLPLETTHTAANEEAAVPTAVSIPLAEAKRQPRSEEVQVPSNDSAGPAPVPSALLAPEPQRAPSLESSRPPSQPESPSLSSQPESHALPAAGSLAGEFRLLAKERPEQAMQAFYRLLDEGHLRNDLALVERAYCGLALVYALRGDGPHAAERLGDARMIAMRRGNTSEVEALAQGLDRLIAAK